MGVRCTAACHHSAAHTLSAHGTSELQSKAAAGDGGRHGRAAWRRRRSEQLARAPPASALRLAQEPIEQTQGFRLLQRLNLADSGLGGLGHRGELHSGLKVRQRLF